MLRSLRFHCFSLARPKVKAPRAAPESEVKSPNRECIFSPNQQPKEKRGRGSRDRRSVNAAFRIWFCLRCNFICIDINSLIHGNKDIIISTNAHFVFLARCAHTPLFVVGPRSVSSDKRGESIIPLFFLSRQQRIFMRAFSLSACTLHKSAIELNIVIAVISQKCVCFPLNSNYFF